MTSWAQRRSRQNEHPLYVAFNAFTRLRSWWSRFEWLLRPPRLGASCTSCGSGGVGKTSTARLIANPVAHKLKAAAIDELIARIRGAA